MEEAVLRPRSSIAIHVRHVQLQREKVGTVGDDAARRIHGGLHRSFQW